MAYNPVIQAQRDLGRVIRGGFSDLGNRPLNEAKFNLFEKQTLADIDRNKRADARADRRMTLTESANTRAESADQRAAELQEFNIGMANKREERQAKDAARASWLFEQSKSGIKLNKEQAIEGLKNLERTRELQNQPITPVGMAAFFLGANPSRESTSDFLANGKMDQILEATGGKMVQTKDGMRFMKANGQMATWRDMPNISGISKPVLVSGRDPVLFANQKIREYEKFGTDGLPPEELQKYEYFKKAVKSPQWKIAQYEKLQQNDILQRQEFARRQLPTTTFDLNIVRREKKIAEQKGILALQSERQFKKDLEEIKIGKPQKATIEKNADFYYKTFKADGISKKDALEWAEKVQSKPQRLALAKALIDQIDQFAEDDVRKMQIREILESQELVKKPENDPDGIRELLFK